ncbi:MAG TPA: cytochrome c3 family protein [Myxococcota bacterium]|nr:cytochrome c3 family protein [Myxococcota bacterium]HQK51097.1 cytochrome c3 family protein [Myxococcota bacterium]
MNGRHRVVIQGIAGIIVSVGFAPGVRAEAPCLDCHSEVASDEGFRQSPHQRLGGGSGNGPCVACHGDVEVTDDEHPKPPRVDCVRCHQKAPEALKTSVHGEAGDDGPSCVDCHGTHDVTSSQGNHGRHRHIASHCGACHDQEWKVFQKSWHGQSPAEQAATCSDCHGGHGIRRPTDPQSTVHRLTQAETCAKCHSRTDLGLPPESVQAVKDYFGSVHGLAISRSGLLVSATCSDCHGFHDIQHGRDSERNRIARARIPETCGKCHQGVLDLYRQSVHGRPLEEGNLDVPVCTDCHRSHTIQSHYRAESSTYASQVSATCLKCHAQAVLLNRYGIPEARGSTYLESYHGASAKLGDTRVANCASCHEAHDIRAHTDPQASTYPDNLPKTCGKCHRIEDVTRPLKTGRIHATLAQERHWLPGLVERIYIVALAGMMGFFLSYIVAHVVRSTRKRHGA